MSTCVVRGNPKPVYAVTEMTSILESGGTEAIATQCPNLVVTFSLWSGKHPVGKGDTVIFPMHEVHPKGMDDNEYIVGDDKSSAPAMKIRRITKRRNELTFQTPCSGTRPHSAVEGQHEGEHTPDPRD